jgi:hypothetical protein
MPIFPEGGCPPIRSLYILVGTDDQLPKRRKTSRDYMAKSMIMTANTFPALNTCLLRIELRVAASCCQVEVQILHLGICNPFVRYPCVTTNETFSATPGFPSWLSNESTYVWHVSKLNNTKYFILVKDITRTLQSGPNEGSLRERMRCRHERPV